MKKLILSAAWLGFAAAAALMCAGCGDGDGYGEGYNGSEDLNTFLGMVNGKLPSIPSRVTVSNRSAYGVTLEWSPDSRADKYYVYREDSNPNGYGYDNCGDNWNYSNSYKVGSTSSASYSDVGLDIGRNYCYTVTAVNKYGETRRSRTYKVKTLTWPESPVGVTATAQSSTSVVVSWSSVSDAEVYYVYRRTASSGSETRIGRTTSLSYTDTGLSPSTTYYYWVLASNELGESEPSYIVSCTTPRN
ncbi:MAG: fibronectin type III domain-containing protein [Chitinispirillales bacterium]|jgi:fibronectin type 3 domain-containing protein|nr:fibronectin type III domain-containing protein [Chitinispirillales bacterium]